MDVEKDMELIAQQERELVLLRFDAELAWELGSYLRDIGRARNAPIAIDIQKFGQGLFFSSLPGATPDNAQWIRRKSNVVARFHRSSYAIGLSLKLANTNLNARYAVSELEYSAHGGAFPIQVQGAGIIGSVTVSGLPQRQDHQLVVEALCHFTGRSFTELALPMDV
ncbi:MAG TPA: heme-degrading domain-containing protein [Opitutaceae bacterium]|nr:heme-degrading domain-containing protein [Opitutaceae bacterium]